ncbi:hypothetical protein [Methylobacterium sp. Gmos1]
MPDAGGVRERLVGPAGRSNVLRPGAHLVPGAVDWRARDHDDDLAAVRPGSIEDALEVVRLSDECTPAIAVRLDRMRRIGAVDGLAGIALTIVVAGLADGPSVILLAVASGLGLAAAASFLFAVGEIAPSKHRDDEDGAPAPFPATGRA